MSARRRTKKIRLITQKLAVLSALPPVIQVLNKSDLTNEDTLAERKKDYEALYPRVEQFAASAKVGTGVEELKEIIKGRMPEGEALFPHDQVTDYYEREIAADLIREAALGATAR